MRIIIAGVICLLASSLSASDLFDVVQSLREQAWESEYIPESTVPVVPLTDYDEFEVIELFRAETIEELEASLTDGYPFAWLEETLKDESIPWEDRYWLDCRMRAAISQNLHVFYDTENNPVYVDADAIFPGEYYWQELMIVDPGGHSIPMILDLEGRRISDNEGRPVLPRVNSVDIGLLYNPFGRKVGDLALAFNGMSLSRDASIGVYVTGQTGEFPSNSYQYYACLLYPDGSFREIPFDRMGEYSGTVSGDGNILVFFKTGTSLDGESYVEIMDRDGNFLNRLPVIFDFANVSKPSISFDGRYASCWYREESSGGHSAVIDVTNSNIELVTEHTGTDVNSVYCSFSPDGNYACIGGFSKGRIIDLTNGMEYIYPETAYRDGSSDGTRVSCSNSRIVTALSTLRSKRDAESSLEFRVYVGDSEIFSVTLDSEYFCGRLSPEVSPNGHFLYINASPDFYGVSLSNTSSIIYQVSERRR